MKKYPEYKDSEIEWIGEIPKDWQIQKLKYCFEFHQGGAWGDEPHKSEVDLVCLRVADFNYQALNIADKEYTLRSYSKEQAQKLILHSGDLLIEKSGGGEKTPVGRVVIFDKSFDCVFANFIELLRLKNEFSNKYINSFFSSIYAIGLNKKYFNQTTGIQNLNVTKYLEELCCFPPKAVQKRISDYLDVRTTAIDNLIADKQKLIELLKEKRQAIISEAVTKGLDKNAKMKDSGIEWIGEIPEEWEVKKIKYITELYPKCNTTHLNSNSVVTFTPMECVKTGELEIRDVVFSNYSNSYNLFCNRDILLAKVTPCFENQNIVIANDLINGIGFGSSELFVFRCYGVNIEFLYYYFLTNEFLEFGKSTMYGVAGLKRVNADLLKNRYLALPPVAEQVDIINCIKKQTTEVNTLIADIATQIEKLKEYRQSVISEAVTGKVMI